MPPMKSFFSSSSFHLKSFLVLVIKSKYVTDKFCSFELAIVVLSRRTGKHILQATAYTC